MVQSGLPALLLSSILGAWVIQRCMIIVWIDWGPGPSFTSGQGCNFCPDLPLLEQTLKIAGAGVLLTVVVAPALSAYDVKAVCASGDVCMLLLVWHMLVTA